MAKKSSKDKHNNSEDKLPDIIDITNENNIEVPEEIIIEEAKEYNIKEDLKTEIKPESQKEKISIINLNQNKSENPKNENSGFKNHSKITIMDISRKKEEHSFKDDMYSRFEDLKNGIPLPSPEKGLEKVLDSMIYMGSGFIASTDFATRTFAAIATKLIK